jgi:hypothetical protein
MGLALYYYLMQVESTPYGIDVLYVVISLFQTLVKIKAWVKINTMALIQRNP